MKFKALFTIAMLSMTLGSCNNYVSFQEVSPKLIGVGARQQKAKVVSTLPTTIKTNDSTSIYSSIAGAAIGYGAGQLLGSGKGRVAAAEGFGVLGMLAGNALGNAMTTIKAERVTVRTNSGRQVVFTQPIFREFGPLYPGQSGTLYTNGGSRCFVPSN